MTTAKESKALKDYPDVLNVKDLCAVLDVSGKTAYGLLRNGIIRSIRIGRVYRIPEKFLYKYLR